MVLNPSFLICIFEFKANQIFYDAKTEMGKKCNTSYEIPWISWSPQAMMNSIYILFFLGNPVHTWKYICATLYHVFLHLSGANTNKAIWKQLFSTEPSNLIRPNLPNMCSQIWIPLLFVNMCNCARDLPGLVELDAFSWHSTLRWYACRSWWDPRKVCATALLQGHEIGRPRDGGPPRPSSSGHWRGRGRQLKRGSSLEEVAADR